MKKSLSNGVIIWLVLSSGILAFIDPLQTPMAYAESLKDYAEAKNLLPAIEVSPNVFYFKGENYNLIEDYNTGEAKWISTETRLTDYLDEVTGYKYYADHIVVDNGSTIKIETLKSPSIVFDKNTCGYTLYNSGRITPDSQPVLPSISWIARSSVVGSGEWQYLDEVNNASCQSNVIQTPDGYQIEAIRTVLGDRIEPVYVELNDPAITSDTVTINGTSYPVTEISRETGFFLNGVYNDISLYTNNSTTTITDSNITFVNTVNGTSSTYDLVTFAENGYTFDQIVSGDVKFKTFHRIVMGDEIKESFIIENNDSTFDNHTFGATQTIHTGQTLTIGDNTFNIQQANGQRFDKDWIIENKGTIMEVADSIDYDFDVGLSILDSIFISYDNGVGKVSMDYDGYGGIVPVGTGISIDPSFALTGTSPNTFDLTGLNLGIVGLSSATFEGNALSSQDLTSLETAINNGDSTWTYSSAPSNDFVVTSGGNVEALVVAGGGAGGGSYGGGGGAGGLLYSASKSVTPQTYTITVGDGGHSQLFGTSQYAYYMSMSGENGGNSVFDSMTAIGGGGGRNYYSNIQNGGSGGGGSVYCTGAGSGTAGQGNNGADGATCSGGSPSWGAGGGGGAGGAGSGVNGGAGLQYSISGTAQYYAGGGGGARGNGSPAGSVGGSGVGGAGTVRSTDYTWTTGTNPDYYAGDPNTGSGGGGSEIPYSFQASTYYWYYCDVDGVPTPAKDKYNTNGSGDYLTGCFVANDPTAYMYATGRGGSGTVIISYPTGNISATGGTVTTSGGNTIHTFNYISSSPTLTANYVLATVPTAPTNLVTTDGLPISLSYSTPSDDGFGNSNGAELIGYKVYRSDNANAQVPLANNGGTDSAGLDFTDNELLLNADTQYKVHTFTSSGTFSVTSGSGNIEYLVVGGGGGGGNDAYSNRWSGGGGAGGFRTNVVGAISGSNSVAEPSYSVTAQNYAITVGAGGAGGSGNGLTVAGSNGQSSSIVPTSGTSIISYGGGGGGAHMASAIGNTYYSGANPNGPVGSGGGADQFIGNDGAFGTIGQGYDGGQYGGSGAGGIGAFYTTNVASDYNGGAGLPSKISGTVQYYAGGGGGGNWNGGTWLGNSGNTGGAANDAGGGIAATTTGGNGGTNKGGGGGGTHAGTGGTGGSGIVIIRYVDDGSITATGGTVTTITETTIDNSPNTFPVTASSGSTTTGFIDNGISAPNLSVTSSLLPDGTDSFTVGSWVKQGFPDKTVVNPNENDQMNIYSTSQFAGGVRVATTSSTLYGLNDLQSVTFELQRVGTPSGTVDARIYNNGVLKATSTNSFDASTLALNTSWADYTFTFENVQPLTTGDNLVVYFAGGDGSNYVRIRVTNTDTYDSTNTHFVRYASGSWDYSLTSYDTKFTVVGKETAPANTKLLGFTNSNGDDFAFNVGTTTSDFTKYVTTGSTADHTDDFSSNLGWSLTASNTISGGTLNHAMTNTSNDKSAGFNISSVLGTLTYGTTMRFSLERSDFTTSDGCGVAKNWVVLTSGSSGYSYQSTHDDMGFAIWNGNDPNQIGRIYAAYDGSNAQHATEIMILRSDASGYYEVGGTHTLSSNTIYYFEMIWGQTNTTWNVYSDSAYTTKIASYTTTTPSGLGGINYLRTVNHGNEGVCQSYSGTDKIDDVAIWINGANPATTTPNLIISATGLADNTSAYHHYALTRDGSSWTLYQDGSSVATATDSTNLGSTTTFGLDDAVIDTNTATGVGISGNTVFKTTVTGWTGGARSVEYVNTATGGGEMTCVLSNYGWTTAMCGFADNPSFGTNNYQSCDYCMYGGNVYENGSALGSFTSPTQTSVVKVTIDGNGLVKYYVDGSLVYTSSNTATSNNYYATFMPNQYGVYGTLEIDKDIDLSHTINIDGSIDEYFIDSTALSAAEINNAYDRAGTFTFVINPNQPTYAQTPLPDNGGADAGSTGDEVDFADNELLLHGTTTVPNQSIPITFDSSTVDQFTINGNTVTPTATSWVSKVRSVETFNPATGGGEIIITRSADDYVMVGFGKDPFAGGSTTEYDSIEFANYMLPNYLRAYESGTQVHQTSSVTTSANDVFKVTMDSNGQVKYWHNGVAFYTSSKTASGDYYVHVVGNSIISTTVNYIGDATTITDSSPNNLTVTTNSGTTTTGVISNAISAPNLSVTSSLLPDGTDSFTVGSWVKQTATPTNTKLFGFTNANGENISFDVGTTTASFDIMSQYNEGLVYYNSFDSTGTFSNQCSSVGGTACVNNYSFTQPVGALSSTSKFGNSFYQAYITNPSSTAGVPSNQPNFNNYNEFTINAWGKPDGASFFIIEESGYTGFVLNTNLGFLGCGGGWITSTTGQPIPSAGTWHMLTQVNDQTSNTCKFYVDGVLYYSGASTNNYGSQMALFKRGIGNNYAGGGYLDELSLWNNALTSNEIGTLYSDTVSMYNGGGLTQTNNIISATGLTDNTSAYQHYALSRDGSSWTLYQNGASVATATDSTDLGTVEASITDTQTQTDDRQAIYNSIPVAGIHIQAGNPLIGKTLDSMTLYLYQVASSSGTYTVGVFDNTVTPYTSALTTTFGTGLKQDLTTSSSTPDEITFSDLNYVIQEGDVLGIKFDANNSAIGWKRINSDVKSNYGISSYAVSTSSWNNVSNDLKFSLTTLGQPHTINIDGSIDEYFIDSTALSATEIQNIDARGETIYPYSTTSLTFNDNTVVGGEDYAYRVSALNIVGESSYSNVDSAQTVQPANAPTNLTATLTQNIEGSLNWTPSTDLGSGNLLKMRIERVTNGGAWNLVTETTSTSPPYVDTTISGGNTYIYRVASVNEAGTGDWSNNATLDTSCSVQPSYCGNAPSFSQALGKINQFILNWEIDNGTGVSGYRIENSSDGLTWSLYSQVPNQTISYTTATDFADNEQVYWRIWGEPFDEVNSLLAERTTADEVNNYTLNYPSKPLITNILLTGADAYHNNIFDIEFDNNTIPSGNWDFTGGDAITDFRLRVENIVNQSGWIDWVTNSSLVEQNGKYVFNSTELGTSETYNVQISVANDVDWSDWSDNYTRLTTYPPPTIVENFQSIPTNENQIDLIWKTVLDDGGSLTKDYEIRYLNNTNNDVMWSTLVSNSSLQYGAEDYRYHNHTLINPAINFTYSVREGNYAGWSDWSMNMSAVTFEYITAILTAQESHSGDAINMNGTWTMTEGVDQYGITAISYEIINDTYPIRIVPLNITPTKGENVTIPLQYLLQLEPNLHNLKFRINLQNSTGVYAFDSPILSVTPAYQAQYVSSVEGNYQVNYTHDRNSAGTSLELVVNRPTAPFQVECNFKSELFEDGDWQNLTDLGYYNVSQNVKPTRNVYIQCYNDELLFTTVSYGQTNATLALTDFTDQLGSFFGVPLPFLFVIFLAAIFTGRSAPTGIIFLAASIGVMGVMGYFPDPTTGENMITATVWGMLILITGLGIFMGKRFF